MRKAKETKMRLDNNDRASGTRRISVYIYDAQLEAIDKICRQRNKTRRIIFLEAFQTYISLYAKGDVR